MSFGDKTGMGYDDGVSTLPMVAPKFIKSTTQEPKFKLVVPPKK